MPPILLTVYPDECDAFGHLNQAAFLSLFERARWEMLRAGPGMDVFDRTGAWPAVRRTVVEYHAAAYPGDVLRFEQELTHVGRTSFTMRQAAHRSTDDALIATAEFVFVCVSRNGRPVPVPEEFNEFMAARRRRPGRAPAARRQWRYARGRGAGRRAGRALRSWVSHSTTRSGPIRSRRSRAGAGSPPTCGAWDSPTRRTSATAWRRTPRTWPRCWICWARATWCWCGLSMGGYVAFEFLRRWRERVRALVLVDTRAEADTPEGRMARDTSAATAREQGAEAVADAMLPKVLGASTREGCPRRWTG